MPDSGTTNYANALALPSDPTIDATDEGDGGFTFLEILERVIAFRNDIMGTDGLIKDAKLAGSIARDTEVTAAVAALVASAPGTLDTLKELADAIGDDPNYATTITNLLALKAQALVPTAVKTANYNAAAGDFVPVDTTSGAVTVTLPTAPADKTRVAVKLVILGGSNAVTIACGGSDVFNKAGGGTTLTLSLVNQAVSLQYKSSSAIWYVVADDEPLSGLDARFASTSDARLSDARTPTAHATSHIPGGTDPTSLFVRKTGDKTVTSSIVLQDDDALALALLANDTYEFEAVVFYDASTTGDIKFAFTVPAGATLMWGFHAIFNTATSSAGSLYALAGAASGFSGGQIGGLGAGTKLMAILRGLVVLGATPGNLQLQWAQGVSDGTASTVFTNSFMTAKRVA